MDTGKARKIVEEKEVIDSTEMVSDILISKLNESSEFTKIAREACKLIGIQLDDQGYWWLWNPKEYKWEVRDMVDIFNAVDDKITDSTNTINQKIKTPLKEALERQARRNKPKQLDWKWIQFKEKLYNFETGKTMQATSEYFISNPIPWNVGTTTETPVLDKLLGEWLDNEKKEKRDIMVLKDLFAFCLPTKYFIKLVPFLYGGGNDGKSQYIKLVVKFLGKENCTATTLNYIENSNFGTYNCFKKLLCQINEVPKNEIKKITNIKTISGRDETPVEAKGKNARKEELYSKIFMVGNDIPITRDESIGFWERIHPIEFPNYFEEKGDVFESVPEKEFENLALWCLERLKTLATDYKISGKKNIKDTREEYKLQANQLMKFLEEENYLITHNQGESIMVTVLNSAYNQWADSLSRPMMEGTEFKAKLQNLGLTVEPTHCVIDGTETRRNFVFGIKKVIPIPKVEEKEVEVEAKQPEVNVDYADSSDMTDTLF
jgi:phage/plasmid-associated DNA primase